MKPAIATTLCKLIGHPGISKLARTVRDSGRDNALLFMRCPRCGVEIISIEMNQRPNHAHAHAHRTASAFK